MVNNKQTRVLLVTDFFYPHWTGIAKSMFSLTQALGEKFAITVLTVRFDRKLAKTENVGEVAIIRSNYLFTISRSKYSLAIIFDFFRLLARTDCVLVNSPSANIVFFSLVTKLFGKKLLIFHQGDLILPPGFLNSLIEKIFDLSCFLSFSCADKVSTYTTDYARHSRVLRGFLSKFTPVLLPVMLRSEKSKGEVDKIIKLKEQKKIVFGFAGRFVEEKGFDILFRAIPAILEKLPSTHFVIAGQEMSYEDFFGKNKLLFDQVKNHLTFLGLLDDQKLKKFYEGIDAIIVPSRSDCFNLVQAEAMLCGTPALVSDIPGLRYLVKESGFGLLFKPESPDALTQAVIRFENEKGEIRKKDKNLRELLNIDTILEHAEAFIEK